MSQKVWILIKHDNALNNLAVAMMLDPPLSIEGE